MRNDLTVEQHNRESIRIARIARELLKKFAAAFRLFQDMNVEGKLKGLKSLGLLRFMVDIFIVNRVQREGHQPEF